MNTLRLTFLFLSTILFFTLSAQVPNYVPKDSLLAWYRFDGSATNSTNGWPSGTMIKTNPTKNRLNQTGKALQFSGDTCSVSIKNTATFDLESKPVSFSAWVYSTDSIVPQGVFRSMFLFQLGVDIFTFNQADAKTTELYYSKNFFETYDIVDTTFSVSKWTMYTITINDSMLSLYNNATKVAETPLMLSNGTNSLQADFLIGNNFLGSIDDVGIWQRCLTETEIFNLYNNSVNNGIRELKPLNEISFYPNPATDLIHFVWLNPTKDTQYTIVDLLGRVKASGILSDANPDVNLSELAKGMYFISLNTNQKAPIRLIKD